MHDAGQPTPGAKSIVVRTPTKSRIARLKTFGELIELHIDDMCDVGKSPRRSKAAALDMLQRHLGKCNIALAATYLSFPRQSSTSEKRNEPDQVRSSRPFSGVMDVMSRISPTGITLL